MQGDNGGGDTEVSLAAAVSLRTGKVMSREGGQANGARANKGVSRTRRALGVLTSAHRVDPTKGGVQADASTHLRGRSVNAGGSSERSLL